MHNKKITIAIPTYNRHKYLDKSLASLLISINNLSYEKKIRVLVCIFDNSEGEESYNVVNKYVDSISLIYKKNHINIGSDKNIIQCFKECQTDYLAIISDDDFTAPDYFKYIFDSIDRGNDLIFLRSYGLVGNNDLIINIFLGRNYIYNSIDELIIHRNIQIGFLSTTIYKVSNLDLSYIENALGTNLIQVAACISVIRSGNKFEYIDRALIGVTRNNSGGYSPIIVFIKNFSEMLCSGLALEKNSTIHKLLFNRLLYIFFSRSLKHYKLKNNIITADEWLILDDIYSNSYFFRKIFKRLILDSSYFSILILNAIYAISNILCYPNKSLDFIQQFLNHFIYSINNIKIKYGPQRTKNRM